MLGRDCKKANYRYMDTNLSQVVSDRFGLVEGLEYRDLTFSDRTIYAGGELIATIRSIDTGHLTIDDFKVI
jgi:hypothetical protein